MMYAMHMLVEWWETAVRQSDGCNVAAVAKSACDQQMNNCIERRGCSLAGRAGDGSLKPPQGGSADEQLGVQAQHNR